MTMFRDDHDALLARLDALDAQVARYESELAARDARIAELEAEVVTLRRDLIEAEASKLDAQRRKHVDSKPISSKSFPIGSAEARAEADRMLAEGVDRYRAGDKAGATACFERGLTLVPNDPQLVRALRRYN